MTLKVISRSFKLKSLNFDFFLIFMQLLIQNCTKMAPFIQVGETGAHWDKKYILLHISIMNKLFEIPSIPVCTSI